MDKLLTPQEMARVLGLQPSTICQWTHQGFIPHVKLGKFVRFNAGKMAEWLEKKQNFGRVTRRIDVNALEF
jgi:excisionase family DNA binding protein